MKTINILVLAVIFLMGCDTFFGIQSTVTDAVTGNPIPDAKITLVLDKGVEEPDLVRHTGTNGIFNAWINEPSSAWATLTVEKSGYDTWATQFRGRPKPGIVIKLKPKQ